MDSNRVNGNDARASSKQRYFLFTYPRTASHLFMRMLALHDNDVLAAHPPEATEYFFMPMLQVFQQVMAIRGSGRTVTNEDRTKFQGIVQGCADNMEDFVVRAESEGKTVFIKEHVQIISKPDIPDAIEPDWTATICGSTGNEVGLQQTLLPTEFLLTFKPTFLIRHPALTFPSFYRAIRGTGIMQEEFSGKRLEANLRLMFPTHLVRNLYEWYRSTASKQEDDAKREQLTPIIVDASEFANYPDLLLKYAQMVNIVTPKLSTEWKAYDKDSLSKLEATRQAPFLSTLASSTGVVKQRAPLVEDIDVEKEHQKWCEELGTEVAGIIKRMVEKNLPDYEYLWSQRLTR